MRRKGSLVTIRHPARPLRGVTQCYSHKLTKHVGITGMWKEWEMDVPWTPFCTLCGISRPLSSKQRTMSTSDEAPPSFYKRALFLTRELRVIITLCCYWSFHMPDDYVTGQARCLIVTRLLFLLVMGGVFTIRLLTVLDTYCVGTLPSLRKRVHITY